MRSPSMLSRRELLGAAAVGAIAVPTGLGVKAVAAAVDAAGDLRIRRNINDPQFGTEAAAAYRAAVRLLRDLPAADPRSWLVQANIHQEFCPHWNWYFLPWHRAYLLALEEICIELTGDAKFALPYWNWTIDRQLPREFVEADVNGSPNALHDATREMTAQDTLTTRLSPFGVDVEALFGQAAIEDRLNSASFQAFGSFMPLGQDSLDPRWQQAEGLEAELEAQPHDYGHGAVGGNMGSVDTSPRDPIFYLHHANLDRLWAHWSARGHGNDPNPLWRDFVFAQNFWDRLGQARVDYVVRDLESTQGLGYVYDDVPPVPAVLRAGPDLSLKELAAADQSLTPTLANVAAARLALPPRARDLVQDVVTRQETRLYAVLRDVQPPADRDVNVRVFINCPYLSPLTPTDDPHYAGSFTFFVPREAHHPLTRSVAIDISDTVRRLAGARPPEAKEIVVQLLPLAYGGQKEVKADFSVKAVEILTL